MDLGSSRNNSLTWLERLRLAAQADDSKDYEEQVSCLISSNEDLVFEHCVQLLNSDSPEERQVAVDVIGQFESKAIELRRRHLANSLKEETHVEVKVAILNNLKFVFDEPRLLAEILSPYLINSDEETTLFALMSFPQEMAREHSEQLIELCYSEDKEVGFWAADLLASDETIDGRELRDALLHRVKRDPACEVAYLALAQRRERSVVPLLVDWLQKGALRPKALEAVLEWPQLEYVPALKSQIEWWQDLISQANQCVKACVSS